MNPFDKDKEEKHPSYGVARFSRITGGSSNFFGTVIKPVHYIQLEIFRGIKQVCSTGGEENFIDDSRIPLITVRMTSAEFAELITTMNMGSGIPVTLDDIGGERIEDCPPQSSPLDIVTNKAGEGVTDTSNYIKDTINEVIKDLRDGKLGKKSVEEVIRKLEIIPGRLESNTTFYKKQIVEVGEKVTVQVRSEIENTPPCSPC